MVILAPASMVGCAPTPTTARAATPAVVGFPTAQATSTGPHDEKLVEQSAETRFQLDLHLSDAALAQFTPSGWSSYVEPSSAARDANLCVIFIDGVTVNNQTGQPIGTNGDRLVQLWHRSKTRAVRLPCWWLAGMKEDQADVPGPFGNCLQTGMHKVTRSTSDSGSGSIVDSQDWVFEGTSGKHLELHAAYDRGTAAQAPTPDTSFYWAGTHRFTRSRGRNKS